MESINTHSNWVKEIFEKDDKIAVENHPNRVAWQWSHHEKLVCIDEIHAFMGGLDLCGGRWDSHDHPILDATEPTLFPGIDYCNPYTEDFPDLRTAEDKTNLKRAE